MKELSLFSGAGGGLLATKHLLGWETIGYVEIEEYCQKVLKARIADGYLDAAPIFGDIRKFISEGYAKAYQGMVDVVTGGFPCQPFSVAGKRQGADDERNMWPETIKTIRIIRPKFLLLENVPGLLSRSHKYFEEVLKDLAESGFDVAWKIISAAELGAPHRRDRLWIMAHSSSVECTARAEERKFLQKMFANGTERNNAGRSGKTVADTESPRRPARSCAKQSRRCGAMADINSPRLEVRQSQSGHNGQECATTERESWWSAEPDVGRVAHGVACRVDRLKALGNGQVPVVAATAWRILPERSK